MYLYKNILKNNVKYIKYILMDNYEYNRIKEKDMILNILGPVTMIIIMRIILQIVLIYIHIFINYFQFVNCIYVLQLKSILLCSLYIHKK